MLLPARPSRIRIHIRLHIRLRFIHLIYVVAYVLHRSTDSQVYRSTGLQTGSASEREFSSVLDVLVPPIFPSSTRHRPIAQSLVPSLDTSGTPIFPLPTFRSPSHTYTCMYRHLTRTISYPPSPAANPSPHPPPENKALSLCLRDTHRRHVPPNVSWRTRSQVHRFTDWQCQ